MDKSCSMLEAENKALKEEVEKLKKKYALSNSAFLNIVGKSLDGIVIVDSDNMVVYTNYAAMELFDRNLADLLGEPLDLDIKLDRMSSETVSELNIPQSDGSIAITEVSVLPTEWNNKTCRVVSFRDITERKKNEEQLEYVSKHDALTNLPNRLFFEKKLNAAMEQAKTKNALMGLLYFDLDNFKIVNDSFGHLTGDLLLKKVSESIQRSIRETDTVARLGGDEFAIIIGNLKKPQDAERVAQTVIEKISEIKELEGKKIYVNASVGIAIYPIAGETPIELVKHADMAMYKAKNQGKNQYCFYSKVLDKSSEKQLEIVSGLRAALLTDEFFLEYQPIIDLKQGKPYGVEALLRWMHPDLGLVAPGQFIPIAEKTGLMGKLGLWVIERALGDYQQICNAVEHAFISINLSACELETAEITDKLLACIEKHKIEPSHIVVELTETSIMKNPESTIQKLTRLTEKGLLIAVDDFGTGYSSLSYLKRLPLNVIKLDRSFIADIGIDSSDELIIKSTIELAHNLGFKVVAEGVETKCQLDFLKANNCDYIQGFYFSKPLKLKALQDYIKKYK